MTIIQKRTLIALLLGVLIASGTFAQSGPPPLPPMPQGQLLDVWPFDGTNYLSLRRSAPISVTNVTLVPTWAGNGLQVDSTNAAWITYRVVETNGMTNLNCSRGTIEMWFSPDWNSSDGLGAWGTILEAGNWNTNVSEAAGAWGLYISPDGSGIYFSAQTNGLITNYVSAPISWNAGEWHYIVVTYSATNSALYLEGQFVTNGPGVSIVPGQNVLTNGFSIGSDSATGLLQSKAVFNYVATYNYELDTNAIAAYYADDAPNVYPLASSGFGSGFTMDDGDGPPVPGGGSGTNSGGGYTFNSPHYGSNDFWVEPAGIDTNGMLTLLVHATTNTSSYAPVYELLWTDSLTPPVSWDVYETFLGATNTNVTVLTVLVFPDEPAAFFEAVNLGTNGDSSGIGIPDWWQKEFFGSVGIDPYGDPVGDGYDNLYKYEHGMNPNTYYTPAAPTFSATLNTNGTVLVSWPAASDLPTNGAGAVTGYTLQIVDPFENTNSVQLTQGELAYEFQPDSATLQAYVEGYYSGQNVTLQINYQNGNSAISQLPSVFDPTCTVDAAIARGPQGALYLVASSIPPNVGAIRIMSIGSGLYYPLNPYDAYGYGQGLFNQDFGDTEWFGVNIATNGPSSWPLAYFDVPVSSITNGLYQIPPSLLPLFGEYCLDIAGVGTNGNVGTIMLASPNDWGSASYVLGNPFNLNVPFFDGRTNIQQNINLFLRAADNRLSFQLALNHPDPNGGAFWYDTLAQPTNYVWDGFCFQGNEGYWDSTGNWTVAPVIERNEFEPFEETSLFTNVIFNLNLFDSNGNFTNQLNVGLLDGEELDLDDPTKLFDTYKYVTNNPSYPLGAVPGPTLDEATESWICALGEPSWDGNNYLTYNPDGSTTLPLGTKNIYGLPILAVKYFGISNDWEFATIGTTFNTGNDAFPIFQDVAPPVLDTQNYYFARPHIETVPGDTAFAVTNTTPLFIVPFGQQSFFTAWAKQAVLNGYSGVYAYPQQYFDKAYMADANGNITTNETGLLSEYGDFFPLQPGKIFLTTKPDAATGTVGTNVLNVIKLQLDVNHDGIMDTSFAGPDNTTADRPFVFWINNDNDGRGVGEDMEDPGPNDADYLTDNIRSQRDLEDWARLWICGLPALTTNYQVTLNWTNIQSGSPAINLAISVETNGGIAYLTNAGIAAEQVSGTGPFAPSAKFARITTSNSFSFDLAMLTNPTNCFLFEGAGIGKGELRLTVSQGTNILASTSAFMDLHDVRDMYGRLLITNWFSPSGVLTNAVFAASKVEPQTFSQENETTNIIIWTHGADTSIPGWLNRGDTVFKRLYWAGYHGRFASVRWPSTQVFTVNFGPSWFNLNEFFSYKSATLLKNYASALQSEFPNYNIHMWPHSAGGYIACEAASQGAPFKTLILSSTSVSASCFDTNAPTDPVLLARNGSGRTPQLAPMGYVGAYTNLTNTILNYFNTNDDVLNGDWYGDQHYLKPTPGRYTYNGTTSEFAALEGEVGNITYQVTDPLESRAMVSGSCTRAIGAVGPYGGQINQGVITRTRDVHALFGLDRSDYDHSAIFAHPIQDLLPYYRLVLTDTGN